jgi:hypothetical protein
MENRKVPPDKQVVVKMEYWLIPPPMTGKSTKIRIKDEFSLRTIPIERPIKGFENISECYEIIEKDKCNTFKCHYLFAWLGNKNNNRCGQQRLLGLFLI